MFGIGGQIGTNNLLNITLKANSALKTQLNTITNNGTNILAVKGMGVEIDISAPYQARPYPTINVPCGIVMAAEFNGTDYFLTVALFNLRLNSITPRLINPRAVITVKYTGSPSMGDCMKPNTGSNTWVTDNSTDVGYGYVISIDTVNETVDLIV